MDAAKITLEGVADARTSFRRGTRDDARSGILSFCLASLLASCSAMPPPIPMVGPASHVSALSGTWSGEYSSSETGRRGSIYFTLAAGSDTAFGDVQMRPGMTRRFSGDRERSGPQLDVPVLPVPISIAFVIAGDDSVYGALQPYEDPTSGGGLVTCFSGRLRGERIEGLYVTRNTSTRESTTGEWRVRRQQPKRGSGAHALREAVR